MQGGRKKASRLRCNKLKMHSGLCVLLNVIVRRKVKKQEGTAGMSYNTSEETNILRLQLCQCAKVIRKLNLKQLHKPSKLPHVHWAIVFVYLPPCENEFLKTLKCQFTKRK